MNNAKQIKSRLKIQAAKVAILPKKKERAILNIYKTKPRHWRGFALTMRTIKLIKIFSDIEDVEQELY